MVQTGSKYSQLVHKADQKMVLNVTISFQKEGWVESPTQSAAGFVSYSNKRILQNIMIFGIGLVANHQNSETFPDKGLDTHPFPLGLLHSWARKPYSIWLSIKGLVDILTLTQITHAQKYGWAWTCSEPISLVILNHIGINSSMENL